MINRKEKQYAVIGDININLLDKVEVAKYENVMMHIVRFLLISQHTNTR